MDCPLSGCDNADATACCNAFAPLADPCDCDCHKPPQTDQEAPERGRIPSPHPERIAEQLAPYVTGDGKARSVPPAAMAEAYFAIEQARAPRRRALTEAYFASDQGKKSEASAEELELRQYEIFEDHAPRPVGRVPRRIGSEEAAQLAALASFNHDREADARALAARDNSRLPSPTLPPGWFESTFAGSRRIFWPVCPTCEHASAHTVTPGILPTCTHATGCLCGTRQETIDRLMRPSHEAMRAAAGYEPESAAQQAAADEADDEAEYPTLARPRALAFHEIKVSR